MEITHLKHERQAFLNICNSSINKETLTKSKTVEPRATENVVTLGKHHHGGIGLPSE
jgi:hypothetical protein